MTSLALADLSAVPGAPHCAAGPRLRTVLRHLTLSLLSANVVPAVLFYLCLMTMNVWAALLGALAWCYGAMTWRWATGRRMSRLLVLTMIGLTAKTGLTFASGSTFVYFAQPAANNGLIAAAFLVSLATARPVVARLAADFYPMSDEVALRPRVQQLFWRLTLMWALICLGKAVATMWLLQSQSVQTFVLVKSTTFLAVTLLGVVVTVLASVRVAREEGLLTRQAGTRPASAGSETTSTGFPAALRRTSTT
jgi:intracellular septation protein A